MPGSGQNLKDNLGDTSFIKNGVKSKTKNIKNKIYPPIIVFL
jgi:hypothetical protein